MNESAATLDCMTMQNATTPITIHAALQAGRANDQVRE